MADPIDDGELLAFLRRVAAKRAKFRTLEGDLDPGRLPPRDCLFWGLPPRPGGEDQSLGLWRTLALSRRRVGVESSMSFVGADRSRTAYNRLGLKGHMETSRNWSGAVIASPYRHRPFDFLIGSWTIPNFRRPSRGTKDVYACSTWIGFDGHRRNSRSLPQIGTVQQIIKDNTGIYRSSIVAWRQWWHKDDAGPEEYDPAIFPISVGDQIIASLFVIPGIGVLKNLLNVNTEQAIEPALVPAPRPGLEPRSLDAECVLERPRSLNPPFVNFATPDFDPTTFQCHAIVRGETMSRTTRGGRLIRMVHLGPNKQMETIATPDSPISRDLVTVRYQLA
ncbi:G1 family glutamic endopeptidase [Bosea thiooxidans]